MAHWTDGIVSRKACQEAVDYCLPFPSFQSAWDSCAEPGWLVWCAGRNVNVDGAAHRIMVSRACALVRTLTAGIADSRREPLLVAAEGWAAQTLTKPQALAAMTSMSAPMNYDPMEAAHQSAQWCLKSVESPTTLHEVIESLIRGVGVSKATLIATVRAQNPNAPNW